MGEGVRTPSCGQGHVRQRSSVGGIDFAFHRRSTSKQVPSALPTQQTCIKQLFPAKNTDLPYHNVYKDSEKKQRAPSVGGRLEELTVAARFKRAKVTFDPLDLRQKNEQERDFEQYLEGLPEMVPKSTYIALLLEYLTLKQGVVTRLPVLNDSRKSTEKSPFFAYKTESKHCGTKSESFLPAGVPRNSGRESGRMHRPFKPLVALGISSPAGDHSSPAPNVQGMEFTFNSARRGLNIIRN